MNGHPTLTDARIRQALAPAPDAIAPAALLRDALEAVSRTRQRRPLLRLSWGPNLGVGFRPVSSHRLAWLVAATVILALLGAALVAGQLPRQDRAVTLLPLPSAAGSAQDVFAVSWDEAYSVAGDNRTELWHFHSGRWEGPEAVSGSFHSIAVLPGGGLAAATSQGLFVRGPGGWSATPLTRELYAIAASPDGSLWAADTWHGGHAVVQLRVLDGSWREARTICPAGGSFLALTSDGMVWTGGFGYSGTMGLARYDGRTCTAVSLPGGSALPDVVALATGPSGELAVAAFDPPYRGSGSDRAVLVVFDRLTSSTLMVTTMPAWGGYMAFDRTGDLWVIGMPDPGVVRWHRAEGAWAQSPATVTLGDFRAESLAGDGTLWYVDASGLIRRTRL